jgi:dienelactone hydrolase
VYRAAVGESTKEGRTAVAGIAFTVAPRNRARRLRATLVFGLLAAAILVGALAATADAKVAHGPRGAKFYLPPDQLPRGPHGTLIWARNAHRIMPLDQASSTKLVLYKSKTPQGDTDVVSGAVSIPKGKPPKGGWRVITYAHGTTGAANSCAPTRVQPGSYTAPYVTYTNAQLNAWLAAGYAVLRTDYQGLGTPGPHPYLIGESEGRSVLDIVRAARDLDPSIGKRFLIAGHSQGGHAALFAAGEAQSWTPELKLRGTVAYAPASHLLEQAMLLPHLTQPSAVSALAALIVEGATTASPDVSPWKLLRAKPRGMYPLVSHICLPSLGKQSRFASIAPADLLQKTANVNPLYAVLGEQNPNVQTAAPIFLAQGSADTTVPQIFTNELNKELEQTGDDVHYQVYPGVDHSGIVKAAEPQVLPFFEDRLPPGN